MLLLTPGGLRLLLVVPLKLRVDPVDEDAARACPAGAEIEGVDSAIAGEATDRRG